jgi:hypothetical protein
LAPTALAVVALIEVNYLTCAQTAEYAVSSAGSGPDAEHPPTLMSASRMSASAVIAIVTITGIWETRVGLKPIDGGIDAVDVVLGMAS